MLANPNPTAPAGLTLKAWAVINPATGAILSGNNITSAVLGAAGVYTITFTVALASSLYLCIGEVGLGAHLGGISTSARAVGGCVVTCYVASNNAAPTATTPQSMRLEFWE